MYFSSGNRQVLLSDFKVIEKLESQKNKAYNERNRLVFLPSKDLLSSQIDSGLDMISYNVFLTSLVSGGHF
jgi:hypothetical protein